MTRPYRLALPALLVLGLAACDQASGPAAPATPAAAPVAAVDGNAEPAAADRLLERANAALAADRLFEPAGDNALELYLQALDAAAGSADAGARRARRLSDALATADPQQAIQLAISDIFPYGLVWVEQAAASGEREGAERVFALLQRAQPQSNALRRLRETLDQRAVLASTAAPPAASEAAAAVAAPAPAFAPAPATPQPASDPRLASTAPAAGLSVPPQAAVPEAVAAQPEPPLPPAATPAVAAPAAAPRPVSLPVALSQPPPRYPPRALKQRIEGWVLVGFTIRTDGSVDDVRVLDAQPEGLFDREAVGSMQRWRFQPPGEAIIAQRRIEFSLSGR